MKLNKNFSTSSLGKISSSSSPSIVKIKSIREKFDKISWKENKCEDYSVNHLNLVMEEIDSKIDKYFITQEVKFKVT